MPKKLILLGASTGGPGLLEYIISSVTSLEKSSIIIAQHMDKKLLQSFANRLNRINQSLEVILVKNKTTIQENKIYILADSSEIYQNFIIPLKTNTGFYHPTIDILFQTASLEKDIAIFAYLLSGIGADGALGLLALKEKGFFTVAQDEKTSIVYGMPKRAKELGAATKILSIDEIVEDIKKKVSSV